MGDVANRKDDPTPDSFWGQPELARGVAAGRTELLRLATAFDTADADTAHALFTATFRLHAAQWPASDPDSVADSVRGQLDAPQLPRSWWVLRPDEWGTEVPEHRSPGAASEGASTRERLRAEAEAEAHWRRTAAEELREVLRNETSASGTTELQLTRPGRELLVELLAAALGAGPPERERRSVGDLEFDIRLHVTAAPEAEVLLLDPEGKLCLAGLRLWASAWDIPENGPATVPLAVIAGAVTVRDDGTGGPPRDDLPEER